MMRQVDALSTDMDMKNSHIIAVPFVRGLENFDAHICKGCLNKAQREGAELLIDGLQVAEATGKTFDKFQEDLTRLVQERSQQYFHESGLEPAYSSMHLLAAMHSVSTSVIDVALDHLHPMVRLATLASIYRSLCMDTMVATHAEAHEKGVLEEHGFGDDGKLLLEALDNPMPSGMYFDLLTKSLNGTGAAKDDRNERQEIMDVLATIAGAHPILKRKLSEIAGKHGLKDPFAKAEPVKTEEPADVGPGDLSGFSFKSLGPNAGVVEVDADQDPEAIAAAVVAQIKAAGGPDIDPQHVIDAITNGYAVVKVPKQQ